MVKYIIDDMGYQEPLERRKAMSGFNSEKDDFWAVDKLVPKKKATLSPFASSSQVRDYNVQGDSSGDSSERKLTLQREGASLGVEERSYSPEGHSLIKRVTIRKFIDKFDFYGNFRKAALVYYDYKTPKCEFTQYYSYMPQYSQLTSPQKAYYFYWRDEVRHGRYIKCDYSYLYLYVYEILNLPDKFAPEAAIKALCKLWREYRGALPRIDAYFSVWVQDYCFVHGLPCPMDEIRDFIFDVIAGSDFKEFYLSDIADAGRDGTEAMLAYLSDYDWRKTKYAAGDNAEIFRTHMVAAMSRVVGEFCSGVAGANGTKIAVIRRDAFPHSLCTHAVKCKLEIEYTEIAKDDSLRMIITSAVRYTENKLRALLGVKSRLGIKELDERAKRIIDNYFDNIFEIERRRRQRECAPEYEKLYDARREEISFAHADEIERASWVTTARLVSESEDAGAYSFAEPSDSLQHVPIENSVGAVTAEEKSRSAESDFQNLCEPKDSDNAEKACDAEDEGYPRGLLPEDTDLLRKLVFGDSATVSDEAYERINEAFQDSFVGDFVLEYSEGEYVLVEEYKDDIKEMLFRD